MHAKSGDRLRALGREGMVRYAAVSSVRVELGSGTLDVHYPCDGPCRVLLHLTSDENPDPDELDEIRRWAFRALRIPRGESWEMHVSQPPTRCVRSGEGKVAALPTPARRVRGFLVGLAWLCFLALPLSVVSKAPFWVVLLVLFTGAVFTGGLALWWLWLWALRKDGRPGQFGLGSLFFLMAFVSLYLGAVRGLMLLLPVPGARDEPLAFFFLALGGLVAIILSVPFVLRMLDALLWAAVWLVRRSRGRGE
jgi:hypothetical protein